jgi:thiamine-monophosphate kinase
LKGTERQFVDKLRRQAGRRGAVPRRASFALRQGIGDDCAVISSPGKKDLLVTTDFLLEGVHFRRQWQPADALGHQTLARGLSDIAAMGGTPRFAFLSLALPAGIDARWVDRFFSGFFRLAEASGVTLAGGDTVASKSGVLADIMVIGEVPRGTAVLRSGARPGDEIWVTGRLGGAATALEQLRRGKLIAGRTQALRTRSYHPPRLAIGRWLARRKLASAMMDVSDGLSIDLARLCQASGVGACIVADAIPRPRQTSLDLALHGGEDYELLFTVPPRRARNLPNRIEGVRLTRIGQIQRGRRLRLIRAGREELLPVLGFEHF